MLPFSTGEERSGAASSLPCVLVVVKELMARVTVVVLLLCSLRRAPDDKGTVLQCVAFVCLVVIIARGGG